MQSLRGAAGGSQGFPGVGSQFSQVGYCQAWIIKPGLGLFTDDYYHIDKSV